MNVVKKIIIIALSLGLFNKSFAIVPCCVFSRLFPYRRKKDGNEVRTTSELIEYYVSKHPSIETAKLDFEGKNTVVYLKEY